MAITIKTHVGWGPCSCRLPLDALASRHALRLCPTLHYQPPTQKTHPNLCSPLHSIHDYQNQLKALGNDVTGNRGKMLHLILTLCQKVEKAFNRIVDGGEGGAPTVDMTCSSPHSARCPPSLLHPPPQPPLHHPIHTTPPQHELPNHPSAPTNTTPPSD